MDNVLCAPAQPDPAEIRWIQTEKGEEQIMISERQIEEENSVKDTLKKIDLYQKFVEFATNSSSTQQEIEIEKMAENIKDILKYNSKNYSFQYCIYKEIRDRAITPLILNGVVGENFYSALSKIDNVLNYVFPAVAATYDNQTRLSEKQKAEETSVRNALEQTDIYEKLTEFAMKSSSTEQEVEMAKKIKDILESNYNYKANRKDYNFQHNIYYEIRQQMRVKKLLVDYNLRNEDYAMAWGKVENVLSYVFPAVVAHYDD